MFISRRKLDELLKKEFELGLSLGYQIKLTRIWEIRFAKPPKVVEEIEQILRESDA